MIRACLAALSCWMLVGAFGVSAEARACPVVFNADADGVAATTERPDPQAVETKPFTGVASAARAPAGTPRAELSSAGRAAQRLGVLGLASSLSRTPAWLPGAHDARVASRTATTAGRAVDLRREVFRTRPSRRVGGLEAAPEPFA